MSINKAKALINQALVIIRTPEDLPYDELCGLLQDARDILPDATQQPDECAAIIKAVREVIKRRAIEDNSDLYEVIKMLKGLSAPKRESQPDELSAKPDEERIAYHERGFGEMKDIFLLESLRCAGLNICEPALWMGICRAAMKRLSDYALPKRESGEQLHIVQHRGFIVHLDEPLTKEEEKQLREYLDFVRDQQEAKRNPPPLPSLTDFKIPDEYQHQPIAPIVHRHTAKDGVYENGVKVESNQIEGGK